MVTGTTRLPSAFELPSSTAPARIQSNPRSESTFVLPITNPQPQVFRVQTWEVPSSQKPSSTTQGLQRIVGLDTYQPGTLPERAYKRVAVDDDFDDGDNREDILDMIFQSPERPHKPTRSYITANTVSQLAHTSELSVPRMSQLGFEFDWDIEEAS